MDDADRAQQRMEQELELMLSRMPKSEPLPYTGKCYWCREKVGPDQRFCDHVCSNLWEQGK